MIEFINMYYQIMLIVFFAVLSIVLLINLCIKIKAVSCIDDVLEYEHITSEQKLPKIKWIYKHQIKLLFLGMPWKHNLAPRIDLIPEWKKEKHL